MRTCVFVLLGAALALGGGCSNDSGTSGPQVMAVELDVRVSGIGNPVKNATVQVQNMNANTDNEGLAVLHSDINTMIPNHTYGITVFAAGLVQASPEADTIRIPSTPNQPSGYVLETTVQMKTP